MLWAMDKAPQTSDILASNLAYLMQKHDFSSRRLGERSGVAPKTINNMVNGRHKVILDNVEKVAGVFGLSGWQLILPGLIDDIESGGRLARIVNNYLSCTPEGREYIFSVSDRESRYNPPG